MAVLAITLLFCSDPAEEDGTPNTNELEDEKPKEEESQLEADVALKVFSFASAVVKSGSAPTVANTSLLKSNSYDTIFTLPDMINLLRISHPQRTAVKGFYIAVSGSSFHYEVPVFEEESDTVSAIFYEIDLEELEEVLDSYNIPLEITAFDNDGVPIDVIERIVTVERPGTSMCDIRIEGDTTSYDFSHAWNWEWTVLLDHNDEPIDYFAPGKIYFTEQDHSGCCEDKGPCPLISVDPNTQEVSWVYHSTFSISTYYVIDQEEFMFYKDGTFTRTTGELQFALDVEGTDWCNGIPSMIHNYDAVFYYGTHDYLAGDSHLSYTTTRSICEDPLGLCGYGSRGGNLQNSCHAMMVIAGSEGQKEIRMYTKRYGRPQYVYEGGVRKTIWIQ